MTWSLETSCGRESAKIASVAVPYLQGRLIDLGCGMESVWPSAVCVDIGRTFGGNTIGIRADIADLSMFSNDSFDSVFSSHAIEDFELNRVPDVLAEWTRILKVGGYLVLYVPSANLYPKIGQPGANPAHRWDIYPGDLERILRERVSTTCGWQLLESEERSKGNEYSLFIVAQKLPTPGLWVENVWQRNPGGKKRCLVIRYGAIGDAIQVSSVFPMIKEQGYHVTLNCKPDTKEILKHDPHIDEFLVQAQDFVPNPMLGPYWSMLEDRYDRIINLCESIEGALLTMPGRLTHGYPADVRKVLFGDVDYLERQHDICGARHEFNPRFYTTKAEDVWANATIRAMGGQPVVLWAVTGSSNHKVYPFVPTVAKWLLERSPARIIFTGDVDVGKRFGNAIAEGIKSNGGDMSRVHNMCGLWEIRKTLAMAKAATVVVGPETGVLNCVSFEPNHKVIYLSHSSPGNLTRHWKNTVTLTPDQDLCPCYPCHRLHYDWTYCYQSEKTHAALCASSVPPEAIFEAIALGLGAEKVEGGLRYADRGEGHSGLDRGLAQ